MAADEQDAAIIKDDDEVRHRLSKFGVRDLVFSKLIQKQ